MEYETLCEIHKITERKDGCVYKTVFLYEDWVPIGCKGDGKDLIYVPSKNSKTRMRPK